MRALAPTLRTQLILVLVFVWLYALGVGASYWIQTRAHARLEESFRQDLAVLARLPRLRDALRELDSVTDQYLLTGNAQWLDRQREALAPIRRIDDELSGLAVSPREQGVLKDMDQKLAAYLSQQSQWVSLKRAGRLPSSEAARIVRRRRSFDEITGLLVTMKDLNVTELERRGRAVGRAADWTLALILATGLAAGAFIAVFLARFMIAPVVHLRRHAREWSLGREWKLEPERASPEVADLLECMRDMTRRLNLQYEKEQELGRLKSRLVSVVSHEFNNALGVIYGVSFLLKETEASPSPKRADYYNILTSNIRSLSMASRNLLEMGRLESGKFAVKPRKMDIRPVIERTLERLEPLYERKNFQITLDMPQEPVLLRGDPEALTLVAANLVGNAIKYTPANGRITIGLKTDPSIPGEATVYFQDTGIGISKEDQEKLFAAYYRTEKGKKAAEGFGVGLALAHSIVEAHASRLEVQSEPGKGSRFFFKLPVWTAQDEGGDGKGSGPAA